MTDRNYTVVQEAELTSGAPWNYESAKAWGEANGKSGRSVVAKVLSLNLEYIRKPAPVKRPKDVTKAELVAEIATKLEVADLSGLEKATVKALIDLLGAIPA